jgi:NAD(P)-dependent dehydrogenase (short-subunit alcohol dehydrogenase family)
VKQAHGRGAAIQQVIVGDPEPLPASAMGDAELRDRALETADFLEALRARPGLLASLPSDLRGRLLQAAGEVSCPDPWSRREFTRAVKRRRRAEQRSADERALAQTGIRVKREEPVFATPAPRTAPLLAGTDIDRALGEAPRAIDATSGAQACLASGTRTVIQERNCYVCKQRFTELHFFYDSLCQTCGDLNWSKRTQSADLGGRVALITGARVKIGYQAAIMLLRAGASVVVTTRFPRDAAARYAAEADFSEWGHRLQIYGLDLRHTPSVEAFARQLCETSTRLDFVLNNACQTVRRPAGFYAHLVREEQASWDGLPVNTRRLLDGYEALRRPTDRHPALAGIDGELGPAAGLRDPAGLSQLALLDEDVRTGAHIFPRGRLDPDRQQIDLRSRNSWRLALADVSATELLEVQLVNAVGPFVLNARLKPLMLRVPSRDKHIVNVSAMEGQFYRSFKTDKHPHTNMAKAALNMMTRTSASDYIRDGIHMNSVDTGWVTDEDPIELATRKTQEHGFHPPLDIVDGAARICDPIFNGLQTGKHVWGQFLKDYAPTDW